MEHDFIQSWRQYKKALNQRNAALRSKQSIQLCQLWDKALINSALQIDKTRNNYLQSLFDQVNKLAETLFPGIHIHMDYKRGWPDEDGFEQYLQNTISKDIEKGFTQYGPHRADIKIKLDGKSAQHSISRGQQKKLVALLKLAQLRYFKLTTLQQAIVLYDDLPAELDEDNRILIMQLLADLNTQLFVSSVQASHIDVSAWHKYAVFHVEHGSVFRQ